jgi:AAA15 family ATPase/GTPase
MLIQFTVGNYLSFKDKVTLSMEATAIKEHPENVFETPDGRYRLLKSAAIYGANGSGKSNLIKAMEKMNEIISENIKLLSTDKLDIVPFLLSTETESKPSFFEIEFLIENIKYRYGFEIDSNKVHAEWLFEAKKDREKPLFVREEDSIEVLSTFKEGKGLEERTSINKLFLSIVDQFNGKLSHELIHWLTIQSFASSAFDLESEDRKDINRDFLSQPENKKIAIDLYKNIDLGFKDFDVIQSNVNETNSNKNDKGQMGIMNVKTKHSKYDDKLNLVSDVLFDLNKEESKGTNKIFECTTAIIIWLQVGGTLSLDELDASLHPLMTLAITKLFNSNQNNPQNAQLIFTTHDTNLLSKGGFRRDQIYFIEKDNYEASHLYSLAEFKEDGKKVRKDRSFEEDYIQGRYGAIPFIGDFSKLLSNG